jgi:ABC-type lipoprotein release transport system permease subunit
MIGRLIWRNLWRNKRRTLITSSSVVFAVVLAITMKSLQDGAFGHLIDGIVGAYSGYLQVHRQGYWDEPGLENAFPDSVQLREELMHIPGVTAAQPRLESFLLVGTDSLTKGALLVGLDPVGEERMMRITGKAISGHPLTATSSGVAMAGGLARRLRVQVGDTVVLLGQGYHGATAAGKYAVQALLHFGAPQLNNNLVCMPLARAQDLLSATGLVTSWAVGISDPDDLGTLRDKLALRMGTAHEVLTWKQQLPDVDRHIRMDGISFWIWTGILYLIIGFGIFGTVLMMIAERRYELGMLVAIGMGRLRLAVTVLLETVLLSVIGALTGAALALPLVWWLREHPIRFTGELASTYSRFGFEPVLPTIIEPRIFLTQTLVVLCIAVIMGIYPLSRILRMDTLNAMRR